MKIADKLTLLANSKEALRVKLGLPKSLPFSEYYKYASAHPDTAILALFADGKQGAWYDPSDLSTMFKDAAGTIPVTTNGDPVGRMLDKSGNGNHATQTVSASRPIYKTDGILHWLKFDGVDDYFESNKLVPYDGNSLYIATALKINNLSTGGIFRFKDNDVDENVVSANYLEEYIGSGGKYLVQRRPSFIVISNREQRYPESACVSWVSNGATFKHQIIPNNSILNKGVIALSSGDVKLGVGVGLSGGKMVGNVYGFIWVSSVITDIERDKANAYLANKAGVTL